MTRWNAGAVGQFTTDAALVVQTWDAWMASATGIEEPAACGQRLDALYPELLERGLLGRIGRVAEGRGVEVLAPALHKYLLPCAPLDPTSRFEHMRQHVTIAPLLLPDGPAGVLITIKDVTARFDRESRLAADLDHADHRVRLGATEALAAERSSPMLLAGALSDSSWRVRRAAATGLARVGGQQVQEMLLEALRDNHRNPALLNAVLSALAEISDDLTSNVVALFDVDDVDTRTYAALALGLMHDSAAVPALLARLSDTDQNVQFHAIEALGRIGDRRAAEPMVRIAESRDFFLSFAALDALASIGDASVAPRLIPLLDDAFLGGAAAACLGSIGQEDVVMSLATALRNSEADGKAIASALTAIHDRMQEESGDGWLVVETVRSVLSEHEVAPLLAAFANANDEEARGLVPVLSWLPFTGIDAALAALLTHSGIRTLVGEALVHRGARAAPFIATAASTGNDETRKIAGRALGRIGSRDSVPTLLTWLSEASESDVIMSVAGALAAIGDTRAFEPLLDLLGHPDVTVRQVAVSSVSSIGHPDTEQAVHERLSDPSPRIRESAVRIAGYFAYPSVLSQAIALCADSDDVVRRAAVEALGNFDSDVAAATVHETLARDADPAVRAAAARALGHADAAGSIHALVAACHDGNLWVRYYAARAIGRIGVRSHPVLEAVTALAERDPVTPVRLAAIETIGALNAPEGLDSLIGLVRSPEPEIASAALAAMAGADIDATTTVLADALQSADESIASAALHVLARQRATHAVPRIVAIVHSKATEALRAAAVHTLAAIGDDAALRALVAIMGTRTLRDLTMKELAGVAETSVVRLWDVACSEPESTRELVVEVVGRMKGKEPSRVLASALNDSSKRVADVARRALERIDLRAIRDSARAG